MRVLVFDTETSGLPKSKIINQSTLHLWPFIVQFSYIIFNNDSKNIEKIQDKIIKVKTYNVISEESIKLHGITNEISDAKGVNLISVLTEFLTDVENVDLVVGHNIEFDISMIKVEILRIINEYEKNETMKEKLKSHMELIININKIYCTMRNSIDICKIEKENSRGKYFKFPSLAELHEKFFDVKPKNLHNSLNDVLITLRCFVKIYYDNDILEYNSSVRDLFRDFY
jgi:DNA polymerase III epsilon subunit-like protein